MIILVKYLIVKSLVKTKYANIINFAANKEIIPELLQSNCNPENIFKYVDNFLDNPNKIKEQVEKVQTILKEFKISDILNAVNTISKREKKKSKTVENKNLSNKSDVLSINNQAKSNKSEILVLDQMIE